MTKTISSRTEQTVEELRIKVQTSLFGLRVAMNVIEALKSENEQLKAERDLYKRGAEDFRAEYSKAMEFLKQTNLPAWQAVFVHIHPEYGSSASDGK